MELDAEVVLVLRVEALVLVVLPVEEELELVLVYVWADVDVELVDEGQRAAAPDVAKTVDLLSRVETQPATQRHMES